jgi:hypothetical protein
LVVYQHSSPPLSQSRSQQQHNEELSRHLSTQDKEDGSLQMAECV